MDIDALADAVSGAVLTAVDPEWDAARLSHAGAGDPDAIVRVATVDDVIAAVGAAAAAGVPVGVRGGGHGPWSARDGGLLLDLSHLDAIDVEHRIVRIGGGATWGQVARALAPHRLGISAGDTASVGVGGLTLGGGIGWMVRAWGLAADQLVGAQLVTAEGAAIEVSDASHPDLMWALRGGGGNLGVATRLDFRAHELPSVVFATMTMQGDPRPALSAMRATLADAPPELTVTYMDVPEIDPSAPAGATITACWAGDDIDAARRALAPLLAAPGVDLAEIAVQAYPDILLDPPLPDPAQPLPGFVGGNALLEHLDDDVIDRLVSFRGAHPASVVLLRSLGGAFGAVAGDATAFAARSATWFAMAGAFDAPGLLDERARADAIRTWAEIESLGIGIYGNFTTSIDEGWVERMYPADTLARLRRLKRTWDPGNVFRRNHNVLPA